MSDEFFNLDDIIDSIKGSDDFPFDADGFIGLMDDRVMATNAKQLTSLIEDMSAWSFDTESSSQEKEFLMRIKGLRNAYESNGNKFGSEVICDKINKVLDYQIAKHQEWGTARDMLNLIKDSATDVMLKYEEFSESLKEGDVDTLLEVSQTYTEISKDNLFSDLDTLKKFSDVRPLRGMMKNVSNTVSSLRRQDEELVTLLDESASYQVDELVDNMDHIDGNALKTLTRYKTEANKLRMIYENTGNVKGLNSVELLSEMIDRRHDAELSYLTKKADTVDTEKDKVSSLLDKSTKRYFQLKNQAAKTSSRRRLRSISNEIGNLEKTFRMYQDGVDLDEIAGTIDFINQQLDKQKKKPFPFKKLGVVAASALVLASGAYYATRSNSSVSSRPRSTVVINEPKIEVDKPTVISRPTEKPVERPLVKTVDFYGVKNFLDSWESAWESENIMSYISFYSDDFKASSGEDKSAWLSKKSKLNTRYSNIQVNRGPISVKNRDGLTYVTFSQQYTSDQYADKGHKTLVLRQSGDSYKITDEIFKLKSAHEKQEPIPVSHPKPSIDKGRIENILSGWETAWETENLESYMSHYSGSFHSSERNESKGQWRNRKAKLNALYNSISVKVGEASIQPNGDSINVSFKQSYSSKKGKGKAFSDFGIKTLVLDAHTYKIVDEKFKKLN